MRIKTKILLLIISTIVLILLVTAYYTQRVAKKTNESALKEDAKKIARQVELVIASGGDLTAMSAMRKNMEEMIYLNSPLAGLTDHRISPEREARIVRALDEDLENILYLGSYIARVDIEALMNGSTLRPFFSKVRRPVEKSPITAIDLDRIMKGETIVKLDPMSEEGMADVLTPVYYNGAVFGVAEVKVSGAAFASVLTFKKKLTLFIAAIAIILIAGVLIISMNSMVNRPIQRLLSAIEEVKGGNLAVAVSPGADDEIGRLTGHFNSMVEKLRKNA